MKNEGLEMLKAMYLLPFSKTDKSFMRHIDHKIHLSKYCHQSQKFDFIELSKITHDP